jgi:hypothetical protein
MVAVDHSPTPSIVITAADSNGEGKKALAACETWWPVKSTRSTGTSGEFAQAPSNPAAFGSPRSHRADERVLGRLSHRRGRGQDTPELDLRLLVERDVVDRPAALRGRPQAEVDRKRGERRVVLPAREALLLGGADERAVVDEHRGGVVEEA